MSDINSPSYFLGWLYTHGEYATGGSLTRFPCASYPDHTPSWVNALLFQYINVISSVSLTRDRLWQHDELMQLWVSSSTVSTRHGDTTREGIWVSEASVKRTGRRRTGRREEREHDALKEKYLAQLCRKESRVTRESVLGLRWGRDVCVG